MLGNFIRLLFGQQKDKHGGEFPLQDNPVPARHAPHTDVDGLPELSAPCWRRLILGETEITTEDISLRFLLKNNVRYVKRASGSEEAIAERIRITRNFFIKNRPMLATEIGTLGRLEGKRT
ncbi:hypothetical protein [Noviherbaspirillum autotrophicum]|uniref:Uncharacterized protein n=1 Tax=Noviherbaspirillum autotrophicum TaxID=709839 RepID=A0A0C1Y886_9BURK|nr:hypothetical protein [Noviherbaspirillum autotrophicum]KIF83123.1 hypothetical protein TSA66_23455 [Noviherbaspirillum autotrophicum]